MYYEVHSKSGMYIGITADGMEVTEEGFVLFKVNGKLVALFDHPISVVGEEDAKKGIQET